MQRYKSVHTGAQIDSGVERALPSGAIDQSMSAKLDWEGLINPEFTIAQAGIGGNHGSVPYAADCWKLVSGTVSAAPGGGLVLNGTIRQTLETAAGLDVVASINVTSGTATAAYDDATKQFDITSSGGTIKRAHLGKTGIEDWSKIAHSDVDLERAKCHRFFYRIIVPSYGRTGYSFVSSGQAQNILSVVTPIMRSTPVLSTNGTGWTFQGANLPVTSIGVFSAPSGMEQQLIVTLQSSPSYNGFDRLWNVSDSIAYLDFSADL